MPFSRDERLRVVCRVFCSETFSLHRSPAFRLPLLSFYANCLLGLVSSFNNQNKNPSTFSTTSVALEKKEGLPVQ